LPHEALPRWVPQRRLRQPCHGSGVATEVSVMFTDPITDCNV